MSRIAGLERLIHVNQCIHPTFQRGVCPDRASVDCSHRPRFNNLRNAHYAANQSDIDLGDGYIDGERSVLAFSAKARGLVEQKWSVFTESRPFKVVGYLGKLSPAEVMVRARLWKGLSYSLFNRNCEHFVRYAHGLILQSPQLAFASVLSLLAVAMAASKG